MKGTRKVRGGLAIIIIFLILFAQGVISPSRLQAGLTWYGVQVASFKQSSRAALAVEELKQKGYQAFYRQEQIAGRGAWHRVYLAGFPSREQARKYAAGLKAKGTLAEYYIRAVSESDQHGPTLNQTDLAGHGFREPVERAKSRNSPHHQASKPESKTDPSGTDRPGCAPRPCSGEDLLEVRSLLSPYNVETGAPGQPLKLEEPGAAKTHPDQAKAKDSPPRPREETTAGFGPRVRPSRLAAWDVGGTDLVPFFSSGRVEDHYGWGKTVGGYDYDQGQEAILGLSLVTPF